MQRILIVGLGNIPFPRTRHSIGHFIVDSLAERLGFRMTLNEKLDGYIAEGESTLNNKQVHLSLFKPRPLMNVTGSAVGKAFRATIPSQDPTQLIVIHDTLHLERGRLRTKFGGSPDGHRGVRSVSSHMHSQDYFRILAGVGKAGVAREYVLGPLSSWERDYFGGDGEGTDEVWEKLGGIEERMDKEREFVKKKIALEKEKKKLRKALVPQTPPKQKVIQE